MRHDELIGAAEGTTSVSTRNEPYTALRPTLEDFVLLMPRGAQVIYPKDLGRHPDAGRHRAGAAGLRERRRARAR